MFMPFIIENMHLFNVQLNASPSALRLTGLNLCFSDVWHSFWWYISAVEIYCYKGCDITAVFFKMSVKETYQYNTLGAL